MPLLSWRKEADSRDRGQAAMAVHLIIDGYNLIRRSPVLRQEDKIALELARESLLERLRKYKKIRSHRITVVFDGANKSGAPPRSGQEKGIRVVFSGRNETADAVIKRMSEKEGGKLTVVTSDRDLGRYVASRGAVVIDAEEFEGKLEMVFYIDAKGPEADEENDGRQGGLDSRKKGPSKRLSKGDRRKRQRLRKI
jgi:predicted RNA-binding protein with PIN domain